MKGNRRLHRHLMGLFALVLVMALTPLVQAAAAPFTGEWEGAIDAPGAKLGIVVKIVQGANGDLSGTADIPMQGAMGLQLTQFQTNADEISFAFAAIPATFQSRLSADSNTLTGVFTQNGVNMPFQLERKGSKTPAVDPLAGFDDFVKVAMQEFNVPGVAMSIVKDGQVIFSAGFGLRDVGQALPVTPDTMFQIGSSTKAFTATAFEMLTEEGKLDWEKPVRESIAGYRLWDNFATERITPIDWATHRSGLPRHDLLWVFNPGLDVEQVLGTARYLEPSKDFRTTWQYNNLGYITLGYLVSQATGKPWNQVVQEKILNPLAMTNTTFDTTALEAAANHALPYADKNGTTAGVPLLSIGAAAPAGAINSNITDMAKWVQFQLNQGKVNGQQLVAPAGLSRLQTPQIPLGVPSGLPGVEHQSYGMGWFVESYRGHYHVYHGGNTPGFSALVSFLPKENIGMVILTNADSSALPTLLAYSAMDRLLSLPPTDWSGLFKQSLAAAKQVMEKVANETGREDTQPSHPLSEYCGDYTHPAYGTVNVHQVGNQLEATYYQATISLKHKHYDQFTGEVDWTAPLYLPVRFETDAKGEIGKVYIGFDPSVSPIAFTRKPAAQLTDPAYLAKLAGVYDFQGQPIKFEVQGTTLNMVVPGQPTYKLVPEQGTRFSLEAVPGFSVEFALTEKDSPAGKVTINQQGYVFDAVRKPGL